MDFLRLAGKKIVIFGLANKKSVACAVGRALIEAGAQVVHVVRSEERAVACRKLFPDSRIFLCDVEDEANIVRVRDEISAQVGPPIAGVVHSIAFANYSEGLKPFHATMKKDFIQAVDVSCFSFVAIANHFKELLDPDGSMVTISISTTRMASESYGYMGPIKAALDSSLCFLAKSFSSFSRVRFNAVGASLLKTSASAGIPSYIDSYIFAEQVIPRKQALRTEEVANAAVFLLSERSSGINGQTIIVDAGMSFNFFDKDIVRKAVC